MLFLRKEVALIGMAMLASIHGAYANTSRSGFQAIHLYRVIALLMLILSLQKGVLAATGTRHAATSKETTSSGKPQPVKPPQKSYKKATSPSARRTTRSQSGAGNVLQVYVCKTRSCDMVMPLRRPNGSAPFVYSTAAYLRRNQDFARNTLNIHHIMNQVDPNDPTSYLSQIVQGRDGPSDRHHVIFVHLFPAGAEDSNNARNRRAWADVFIHFFNHANNQRMYQYPLIAHFAGDLTPQNENEAPHLSTYLTIQDTMTVMRDALAGTEDQNVQGMHNNDGMAMIETCLANETAMNDYYRPDHIQLARRHLAPPEEGHDAGEDFGDINPFQYN